MPNWCENDLFVRGPCEAVREFLALANGDRPLDFNRFVPYPEYFRTLDEIREAWDEDCRTNPKGDRGPRPVDGFNSGGYEWCIENWGTKWPANSVVVEEARECPAGLEVLIRFDTAWSPPKPVIVAASMLFPSLVFELRYFDGGAGFRGNYVVAKATCMLDEIGEVAVHGCRYWRHRRRAVIPVA
jgi:hypothetical protein